MLEDHFACTICAFFTVSAADSRSGLYRIRLKDSRYFFVQSTSKLITSPHNHKPDYIFSTHSIIRCEEPPGFVPVAIASLNHQQRFLLSRGGNVAKISVHDHFVFKYNLWSLMFLCKFFQRIVWVIGGHLLLLMDGREVRILKKNSHRFVTVVN